MKSLRSARRSGVFAVMALLAGAPHAHADAMERDYRRNDVVASPEFSPSPSVQSTAARDEILA